MFRLSFLRSLLPLVVLALLAACGSTGGVGAPTSTANMPRGATMQLVLAASELVVGPNRFPTGLIIQGTPANDPNIGIHLTFRQVQDPNAPPSEADALYRGQGLPVGLYVAEANFPAAGDWQVTARVKQGGEEMYLTPMRFTVLEQGRTPAIGTQAPASKNLTLAEQPDIAQITSDIQPDPALYQLSVADALAAKKPFLVAFSTPGYCKTAVCGPNIEVVKKFKGEFAETMNFLHVEVYPYPFGESFEQGKLVAAMQEWQLETEPWTFLVDSTGTIVAKYEGGITLAELEPALKQLVSGS